MEYLQVAIRLLPAGLIDGPASVFVGATGGRKINLATSSPAGELVAPSHKTMSQTTWYQNRGPATGGQGQGNDHQRYRPRAWTVAKNGPQVHEGRPSRRGIGQAAWAPSAGNNNANPLTDIFAGPLD